MQQDWDKFFAVAQIYRASWPLNERNSLSLLEGLALLKHCQFQIFDELLIDWKKEKPEWKYQIKTLEALRKTDIHHRNLKTSKEMGFSDYISGSEAWNSNDAIDLRTANANLLRVSVQNHCSKENI